MRGDLGGDRVALGLGPADQLHRAGRGDVADVQPGLGVRGQQDVAGDDRLLGDRRPAGQAQDPGQLALVHLRALGQPGLLRVLRDHAVEGLHVLQRAPHQVRVGDALAVVGEDPHPGGGVGHRAELGQPLAGQAHGDRADREDVAVPGLAAQAPDLLDHTGGVGDRVGVGHGVHGGEAAERQRPGCRCRRSRRPRGPARAGGCAGRPGRAATIRPPASITTVPATGPRAPASAMIPSRRSRSCGSPPRTLAFLIR